MYYNVWLYILYNDMYENMDICNILFIIIIVIIIVVIIIIVVVM